MAVTISNQAAHLLILQLNSGKALYLAPRQSSGPVDDLEISGNEKIAKLLRGSLIAVTPVPEAAEAVIQTTQSKGAAGTMSGPSNEVQFQAISDSTEAVLSQDERQTSTPIKNTSPQ